MTAFLVSFVYTDISADQTSIARWATVSALYYFRMSNGNRYELFRVQLMKPYSYCIEGTHQRTKGHCRYHYYLQKMSDTIYISRLELYIRRILYCWTVRMMDLVYCQWRILFLNILSYRRRWEGYIYPVTITHISILPCSCRTVTDHVVQLYQRIVCQWPYSLHY